MHASGKSKGGWLLPTSLFAIGRCLNVFASFIAFDFMMSPSPTTGVASSSAMIVERPILIFVCIVVALAAVAFASIQRIWSAFITLSRSQIRLLLTNGAMLASSILLYYLSLRHIGPIRVVLWQACESCMIWIPLLLLSWQQVKSSKRRGAIIMLGAYIILLLAAQSYSPSSTSTLSSLSSGAVVTPSSAGGIDAVPALRGVVPIPLPIDTNNGDGGIIDGELPHPSSIEVAAVPLVAAVDNGAARAASPSSDRSSTDMNTVVSNDTDFPSTSAIYASIAMFISCGINILRKRYVKTHSNSFGGKKRMHAFAMCAAAAMLIPLAFLQLLLSDSTAAAINDDTTISIGGTPVTSTDGGAMALASGQSASGTWIITGYMIIALLGLVVPYYVDSLTTRVDTATNGASIMVDIVTSIVAACFVSICRASDPFTFINCITAGFITYGAHLLSSGGRPASSTPSSSSSSSSSTSSSSLDANLPLFTSSRDNAPWSVRTIVITVRTKVRVIWRHLSSDPKSLRIAAFLLLNFAFMFVELAWGIWSGSLSLISDAGHMLFDSAALAIGLYASYMAKIKENNVYTYGYGRTQVLSGFINSLFLLFIGYEIISEAFERFLEPAEISSDNLLIVSVLGFGVNLIGLIWFHDLSHGHSHGGEGGQCSHGGHGGHGADAAAADSHAHSHGDVPCNDDHGHSSPSSSSSASAHGHAHGSEPCTHDHRAAVTNGDDHGHSHGAAAAADDDEDQEERDHNMESIYLHIVADALGSLAVIASSLAIQYKGWTWMDPLASVAISYLIMKAAWPVVKDSAMLLMQRTPLPKEKKIRRCLEQIMTIDGVISYRDPHFWWLISGELVGTLHVQITEPSDSQRLLEAISSILRSNKLGVRHLTIQLEKDHFISKLPAEARLSTHVAPPPLSSH